MAKNRSVSVRLFVSELTRLMRERRIKSQSELIQSLVSEDLERIRSHRAIRSGSARSGCRQSSRVNCCGQRQSQP
jgi:hypothetical protein